MATPSAAAGTANPSPAPSSAGPAGATPVDDGLASILAGSPGTTKPPAKAAPAAKAGGADPAAEADDTDLEDQADDGQEDDGVENEGAEEGAAAEDDDTADDGQEDAGADDEGTEEDAEEEAGAEDDDPAADPKAKKNKTLDGKMDERIARARAKFTPELLPVFDGVINQVRAETSALKNQLAQVTPELETLRQANEALQQGAAPAIDGSNPLAQIKTETELATHLAQVRKGRTWALKHPKGGTIKVDDGKGGVIEQEISEERVGEILAETEEALQVHGPAQQAYLRDRQKWDRVLAAELPAAAKKDSPLRIQIDAALHRYPWLNQVAEGRMMAADLVIGAAIRAQQRGNAGKGTPAAGKPGATAPGARKPAPGNPPPVPGGQRPAKVPAKAKVNQERVKRFEQTGEDEGNGVLTSILTG
jgi:hypothetical protein